MTEAVTALLCDAFGGEYRALYDLQLRVFAEREPEAMHTLCVKEEVAAYLLAATYLHTVTKERFAYLYCIATARPHRGRGLMRRLLDETLAGLKEAGFSGAFLVPASPQLAAMYQKFGFRPMTTPALTRPPRDGRPLLAPGAAAERYLELSGEKEAALRGGDVMPLTAGWMLLPLEPDAYDARLAPLLPLP